MAIFPEGVLPLEILANEYYIDYPDYSPKKDFNTWLAGYEARVKSTFGFSVDEVDELRAEIVRSMPGKLAVGSALDAYYRLQEEDQMDYELLVAKLTVEFTDPRAKRRFNADMKYNIRKKKQSLKDFAEDIKKDIVRYSYLPETAYSAAGEAIPNRERERDGVRRFKEGIRNENGKEDPKFKRHLNYYLQDEAELTWEHALDVASRYETAGNSDTDEGKVIQRESSSESSDESVEELGAVAAKVKPKSKCEDKLSAITDLVYQNQARIINLEAAQERISANQEAFNAMLEEISIKLDYILAENDASSQQDPAPQWQPPTLEE